MSAEDGVRVEGHQPMSPLLRASPPAALHHTFITEPDLAIGEYDFEYSWPGGSVHPPTAPVGAFSHCFVFAWNVGISSVRHFIQRLIISLDWV